MTKIYFLKDQETVLSDISALSDRKRKRFVEYNAPCIEVHKKDFGLKEYISNMQL